MAKFYKNQKYYIGFGTAGSEAYKASKVWGLGFHLFENGGYKVFRICYLRTKTTTFYWQFERRKNTCINIAEHIREAEE